MNRKAHRYIVTLHRSDGQIEEVEYSVFWDPERDDAADAVLTACAAEYSTFKSGRRDREGNREFTYAGMAATHQPDPLEELATA